MIRNKCNLETEFKLTTNEKILVLVFITIMFSTIIYT